jgi:hypothetical protein
MYKSLTRGLVLAVTGTDPVPTSPNVVTVILTLLQTLL